MSIFVKDNDNGNFHYNLADANYTEECIRPQRAKPIQTNVSQYKPNYNVANQHPVTSASKQ